MRTAIRVAESVAPAVLWVDEIEKSMAGSQSSGSTDGGTSARVLSGFLTWLQEKTAPVFVVATANSIDQLPPELLRRGRLDETFFVDLPDASERREIFEIHLNKRGRDPMCFDVIALSRSGGRVQRRRDRAVHHRRLVRGLFGQAPAVHGNPPALHAGQRASLPHDEGADRPAARVGGRPRPARVHGRCAAHPGARRRRPKAGDGSSGAIGKGRLTPCQSSLWSRPSSSEAGP